MSDSTHPPVVFNAFDPEGEIEVTARNLPHWFQVGAAMFVTFRTADSLPRQVIVRMIDELHDWLRKRGLPTHLAQSTFEQRLPNHQQMINLLDLKQQYELKRLSDRLFHRSLDECYGECLFKSQELAKIVASAIRYHNDDRYDLDSLVVMPNHVHVIVQFRQNQGLNIVGQSWMRYTARVINRRLNRSGVLWQPEPFDHIIRSPEQFEYLRGYVAQNPEEARLPPGQYVYWSRTW